MPTTEKTWSFSSSIEEWTYTQVWGGPGAYISHGIYSDSGRSCLRGYYRGKTSLSGSVMGGLVMRTSNPQFWQYWFGIPITAVVTAIRLKELYTRCIESTPLGCGYGYLETEGGTPVWACAIGGGWGTVLPITSLWTGRKNAVGGESWQRTSAQPWVPITGEDGVRYSRIYFYLYNYAVTTSAYIPNQFLWDDLTLEIEWDVPASTHFTDSYLFSPTSTKIHTTSSSVKGSVTKTHSTSSRIAYVQSKTHTADSYLWGSPTKTHTTSSFRWKEQTAEHSTDSYITWDIEQNHSTDSALWSDHESREHSVDSDLLGSLTKEHSTDSALKYVMDRDHQADSLLVNRYVTEQYTNSLLKAEQEKSHRTRSFLVSSTPTLSMYDLLPLIIRMKDEEASGGMGDPILKQVLDVFQEEIQIADVLIKGIRQLLNVASLDTSMLPLVNGLLGSSYYDGWTDDLKHFFSSEAVALHKIKGTKFSCDKLLAYRSRRRYSISEVYKSQVEGEKGDYSLTKDSGHAYRAARVAVFEQ